jgi:Reverse transcriptase (RNA-dependent DNA polymerase)
VKQGELNNAFLNSLNWDDVITGLTVHKSANYDRFVAQVEWEFEFGHPLALSMKANALDNPNWYQAMNGTESDGYWAAMEIEMETLIVKNAWVVLDREERMHVLPSVWAFKCKRFPDGLVRKLKARFCVRGDCQIDGVDVFDTFAPVVSWQTVRLLLILSVVLALATMQVDYTAAFVQAELGEHEEVFVEMPRGFKEEGKVLRLKRALYGLKQSPKTWFEHLRSKLMDECGFQQSPNDPCLFYTANVVCVVYVDDCLFFLPSDQGIQDIFVKMVASGLDFNEESNVAGFLGVLLGVLEDKSIELTQTGLIDRIITAMGLNDSNIVMTPAEYGGLPKDKEGDDAQESWSYRSILGMMLYLCNTRPDIQFAVSQCARFTANPKRSHEVALKRIGRYLKGTKERGLILKPDDALEIELFVDADFAGLQGYEDPEDPTSVKSRTGYVICIAKCPVVWVSRLQTETALSTMMAEYIALSTAMRDLIPFKRIAEEVCTHMGLSEDKLATIRTKTIVHEDNNGAMILAKLPPGRSTPTSKFFNVKYHWFREQLHPEQIRVVKVASDEQLGDIFTKGLRKDKFGEMRKKLCGW